MASKAKKLKDGTFLLQLGDGNIHDNHIHIAPDNTVLSIKWKGDYKFNRGKTRANIVDAIDIDIPIGYEKHLQETLVEIKKEYGS